MSKEVIAAIISAAATVVAAVIPLYVQNRKLRRETKLIATGLAVAYYYSFITKLFDWISDVDARLVDDKGVEMVDLSKRLRAATLQIYFPADLDEQSLRKTSLKAERDSEPAKICRTGKEPMRIKYSAKKGNETGVLIVADFPMILDAASKHYSGMTRTADFSRAEIWKKTSKQELDEFRTKILKMVEETGLEDRIELVGA